MIGWRSLQTSKATLDSTVRSITTAAASRWPPAVYRCAGLRCSLDCWIGRLFGSLGRILQLSRDLCSPGSTARRSPLDVPASGLVSFQLRKGPSCGEIVKQLGSQGIWIRDLADPNCLRACTHVTTSGDETEKLVEAIGTFLHQS